MTAGGAAGSLSHAVSFVAPGMSSVFVKNLPFQGTRVLTMSGSSLSIYDFSPSAQLGLSAAESSSWYSVSSIVCKFQPGLSASRLISVSVGRSSLSHSFAVSFDTLEVALVQSVNSRIKDNDLFFQDGVLTNSSSVMVSVGQNSRSFSGRVGGTGCESTSWWSVSSIVCKLSQSIPGSAGVSLTVGATLDSMTEGFSFDTVSISSVVTINLGLQMRPAATVAGYGFGSVGHSLTTHLAHSACEVSSWTSSTSLTCNPAGGVAATARIAVSVGVLVASASEITSYDLLSLSGVLSVANCLSSGASPISLVGQRFGIVQHSAKAGVGLSGCEATSWFSDTSIVGQLSRGLGGTLRMILTTSVVANTLTEAASYAVLP
eukprot:3432565-Rhodomonas_salina.1